MSVNELKAESSTDTETDVKKEIESPKDNLCLGDRDQLTILTLSSRAWISSWNSPESTESSSSSSSTKPATKKRIRFSQVPRENQRIPQNIAMKANIFDSHCHLDRLFARLYSPTSHEFYDKEPRLLRSGQLPLQHLRKFLPGEHTSKFEGYIHAVSDPLDFKPLKWLWLTREKSVWLTIGCHPQFAGQFDLEAEGLVSQALKRPRVVALGEIGLDDKWAQENDATFLTQVRVFERQLQLALKMEKTVCLHLRGQRAIRVAKEIMRKVQVPSTWRIHNHCFAHDWQELQAWMTEWPGMKFGFVPDFYDAEVAVKIPLDKLLLESDAPYFFPKALDGLYFSGNDKKFEVGMPGHVWRLALQLANIRNMDVNDVLAASRENVSEIYGIPQCQQFEETPKKQRLPLVRDWVVKKPKM